MTEGELDNAVRRALNIFDQWVDVTGFIQKHTGHYYELQGCLVDAVHCGAQAATGDYRTLESEAHARAARQTRRQRSEPRRTRV